MSHLSKLTTLYWSAKKVTYCSINMKNSYLHLSKCVRRAASLLASAILHTFNALQNFYTSNISRNIIIFISLLYVSTITYAAQPNSILEQILGGTSTFTSRTINIFLLITILGLAPSILMMITSFVRIIIVLSMARSALGLQQSPPNQVLSSLALFMTLFIMYPTFENAYHQGIKPMLEEKMTQEEALPIIIEPFKKFMLANTRPKDLDLFVSIAKIEPSNKDAILEEVPIHVIIPAFMISELRRAFEIGFLVFLPFLIIDVVVSSILMAMGMMMMPPVVVSLPFKIIFFVISDGWYLLCGSLVKSFVNV